MSVPRILVVEDDQIIALDISQSVRNFGYEIVGIANTGAEALDLAEKHRPDLALMDISLGEKIDGIAIARQMRARWSIPVIFLTAHMDSETLSRAAIDGAFAHLTKPIRVEELQAAISIALRQNEALYKLLQSNTWLSSLLGSITEGVLAIDRDGRVNYLNPPAESLTGWYLAEAHGKPVEQVYNLSSPDGRPLSELRIRAAAVTLAGMPETRFLLRGRNRPEVLIEETIAPLWSGGQCVGAVAIFRDLSEALKFEQAQKWESVGVLAAGVAHDFNNLLAIVIGNIKLAMETLPQDSKPALFLEEAFLAGQRASELVSQLLTYAGQSMWRPQTVDLSKCILSLEKLLQAAIPEHVSLSIDLPPSLPTIEADPTQVQQVVMNLVINAAEAIGPELGFIRLAAIAAEANEGVFISVSDTGPGMDAETRSKIFDPFFSTKFLGRGLGLAAVQGIVRSHQGSIDVDTTPGEGSKLTVFFPRGENRPGKDRESTSIPALRATQTILVVDDSDAVAKFIKTSLERSGFSAMVANSGRSALDVLACNEFQIDFVLLDLSMPALSGPETAHLIKARYPQLPICYMSGYTEVVAHAEFSDRTLNGCFLQKPFTPDQLVAKIRTMLREHVSNKIESDDSRRAT